MKHTYHWTQDSWGNMVPPKNADEICCAANELIDKYGAQCEYDNDEMQLFSDELWERYCEDDMIDGVDAKCDLLNAKKGAFQTIEAREVHGLVVAESADIVDGDVRETKLSTSVVLETILDDLKLALTIGDVR